MIKGIKFYIIGGIVLAGILLAGYLIYILIGYGSLKTAAKVNKATSTELERQADRASILHAADVENAQKTARKMINDESHKSDWANRCMPDDIARSHGWLHGCKDGDIAKKGKPAAK